MAKKNLTINPENGVFVLNKAQIPVGNWRNFAGGPTKFNRGNTQRFFEVFLSDEEAQRLADIGYNVKWLEPRNESEPEQAHMRIFINYNVPPRFQPKIWLTAKKGKPTLMDAELVSQFDRDDIERAKLQIRPYDWSLDNGTSGRKAMLEQAYFTLEEDEFGAEFWTDADEEEEEVPFE